MLWIILIAGVMGLLFAAYLGRGIVRQEIQNKKVEEISLIIHKGALTFLNREYRIMAVFAIIIAAILYFALENVLELAVSFIACAFLSAVAGRIGMHIATKANARTAEACEKNIDSGLKIAFNSGVVVGLTVVSLGLLGITAFYFLPQFKDPQLIFGFTFGASYIALFARVGGGIYTKAADVGADLVGKIERGIPEDDPRNPAVIADNVGDNVGDVAGMGADLYESYVGSIVATSALGVAAGLGIAGVIVPMSLAAIGVVASIIGTFFVQTKEQASQGALLAALRRGVFVSAGLIAAAAFFLVKWILGSQNLGIYWSVVSGLLAGIIIGAATEYFTSSRYRPTKGISEAALTGPATVIISGISVGMLSTVVPVVLVGLAILTSFYSSGGASNFNLGLYGIAISAVGMLSTLGITLATDAYGPIADNAGGNAQMSHQPPEVRERTDALDALGNTTAATGKGFAIGSAALTALALIAAYKDQVFILGKDLKLDMLDPRILVGLFLGGMLPYLFCSLTMQAVGRAAGKIVIEVRRQFKEIIGLFEGKAMADYTRCVRIATAAAQKEMIAPSLLAILAPIIVGMLLGVEAGVGLLTGATVSGFVLAIMMANSGGAWDNAKKYIEEGNFGGKGSPSHKAAVVGDTVGDPFKDTAGPSLNILIKLMSMVSIVFAGFIIKHTLMK